MKTALLACILLVALPAAADGWNTDSWNSQNNWNTWRDWKSQPGSERWGNSPSRNDYFQRRQDLRQDYQRQWSYEQRNRGLEPGSQPDRYRADDYYNDRRYDYRNP